MKKALTINIFLAAIISLSALGCLGSVRYSPAEIKDFSPEIREQIKAGEISLGMSLSEVRYAWGAPSMVGVLKPAEDGKMREEWTYTGLLGFKTKLMFTEGKLTEIMSTEPGIKRTKR